MFQLQVQILNEKKDRYGREVGQAIKDGSYVNLAMVVNGLA